eukprot:429801_1
MHSCVIQWLWLHVFFILCKGIYYAHVTSSGDDNSVCSMGNPCGSFEVVIKNIRNNNINDNEIIILINGTNTSTPSYCGWWDLDYNLGTSIDANLIRGNITFIFDATSIKTTLDWWPTINDCIWSRNFICGTIGGCDFVSMLTIAANSNVAFYNLVWDCNEHFMDTLTNSVFYCENCIFRDISEFQGNVYPIMIFSNQATFYKCTFDNITTTTHDLFGLYPLNEKIRSLTDSSLNISHCTFTNILGSNLIQIEANAHYKKLLHIEFSSFGTKNATDNAASFCTTFINVLSHSTFLNDITFITINIQSSSFMDNSNGKGGMQMLYIDKTAACKIYMNDINISYSQYLEPDKRTFTKPESVIYVDSYKTNITMNNIRITTQIFCDDYYIYLDAITIGARSFPPSFPYCYSPVPFLQNNGIVTLNNISLQSDYNWIAQRDHFNNTGDYINSGLYFVRMEYYTLVENDGYETLDNDYQPYLTAIFNDEHGNININNFVVFINSHFSVIYNKGIINIDKLQTIYFDRDDSNYYNKWNLCLYTVITNNLGILSIKNSIIKGADNVLLNIHGGDVTVTDTILSQSMIAMLTYNKAQNIFLNNVSVFEVGHYYSNMGNAFYFSNNQQLYYVAPIHLSSDTIHIFNSIFYYNAPFGVLNIDQKGINDLDSDSNEKVITMSNNKFLITDTINTDTNQSIPYYLGYNYFVDFLYLSSLLTQTYGRWFPVDEIRSFITDISENAVNAQGLITIDNSYQFIFDNNLFYLQNKNSILINNVYFYANPGIDTTNCLASNTFFNLDVYIQSGNILSCKHKQLLNASKIINSQISQCFQTFGSINSSHSTSYFINSSIITENVAILVIDDALFDINNPIHIMGDTQLVLVDNILSSTVDVLRFPGYCSINCYEIISENVSEIRQLIMNCRHNSSLIIPSEIFLNNSQFKSYDFWSPHSIILNDNNINGSTLVFPGGNIDIYSKIVDIFGNTVDIDAYNSSVYRINLINDDLKINTYLTIENGICDLCESDGVYVQGITINDVIINNSYVIVTNIKNNVLFTNDINIEIIECPKGFGVSGAAEQCDQCAVGTYSLTSNSEICNRCDDDVQNIQCISGDDILIDYNHWITIQKRSYNINKILTSDCPNGYCCQNINGCGYLLDYNTSLCALNRDPSIPICGKCMNGYSELLASSNCGICETSHYEYLVLPLIIAVLLSMYLLCFDRPSQSVLRLQMIQMHHINDEKNNKTNDKLEDVANKKKKKKDKSNSDDNKNDLEGIKPKKLLIKDDFEAIKIMVLKVLLYFGQSLLFILALSSNTNDGLLFYILPVLQLFNLSIEFGINSNNKESGYCFLSEMSTSQ